VKQVPGLVRIEEYKLDALYESIYRPMSNRKEKTIMSEVNQTNIEYWMQSEGGVERFRAFSNNTFNHGHNPWGDDEMVKKQMEAFKEVLLKFLEPYPTFISRVVLRDNTISIYQNEVRWIFADHIAIAEGDFRRWLKNLKEKAQEFEKRWNS
jgi:hypothetical protein